MEITIRPFTAADVPAMCDMWNEVVDAGNAFPQTEPLTEQEAERFFAGQTFTAVAECGGEAVGLYILHPNNVGRCEHIANTSYVVKKEYRGSHIGEMLVRDSLKEAAAHSFKLLQFNAVVASNYAAVHLYEKIGFTRLGTIPAGFQLKDHTYADIILYYIVLEQ